MAGIALVNSIGNLGGFISPNVRAWANDSFGTPNAGLYVLSVTTLIAAALLLTLRHRVSVPIIPSGSALDNS